MHSPPPPLDPEYLSEDDLAAFFQRNNNHHVNSNGMKIGLTDKRNVCTSLMVESYQDSSFEVNIYTEEYSLRDFILGFQIKSRGDIDRLDYRHAWMRYLKQDAIISYNPLELEADICFRLYKSRTLVFSRELYFYDEVYEHLTIRENFIDYLNENEDRLLTASERRYKF